MIRLKGHATVYAEIWYDDVRPIEPGIDIVIHRQRRTPIPGARTSPLLSLQTDLASSREEIISQFERTCASQVKRADKKDGLRSEFTLDPVASLDEFCEFYDDFAGQQSIWLADRKWLRSAAEGGHLALNSVWRGDELLVWHAYLIAGEVARVEYSGSCHRERDADFRSQVARANRWLHLQSMMEFKKLGFAQYDWGGLFEDESKPERVGINRFKRGFGGKQVRSYDCTVPITLKGRVWLALREAWRSWKPEQPKAPRASGAASPASPASLLPGSPAQALSGNDPLP